MKPALTRVQTPTPAMFLRLVTLTFDLLTQNKWISMTHRGLEHLFVKFGDPVCIGV